TKYELVINLKAAQVDPWEKAADCERAIRITLDPLHRETLTNIREFWIALAHKSRCARARLTCARLDHAVHGLAHEHVALLELNKPTRGPRGTAVSRCSRRSRVLMVGRPSAPSLDSSTRLSLALRRRSVGSLSCCRRRRHWSVSHVCLTPRRRAMAGHVSGSFHRATSCASSGWFTNMSRPPD